MHRLLALLALLTTSLTPAAALHCELTAAPTGSVHAGAQHHADRPAALSGAPGSVDNHEHAAPGAPEPHPDCHLVMACGMSMLRPPAPVTDRAPLPAAAGPERATLLALAVTPPPADPPPPRRPA